MITFKKIKELIRNAESESVEFKKSTGSLSDTFETVCTFLNGEGGTILIGVSDNGNIVAKM